MKLPRSTGILLHPTSLPGPQGIGSLGKYARQFVDKLAKGGQSWWQILPLNLPGHGGSPYSAVSAFAGNPVMIDLDELVKRGWLTQAEFSAFCDKWQGMAESRCPIDQVSQDKFRILEVAHSRWAGSNEDAREAFNAFCVREAGWLDDFSLFSVLKSLHQGKSWQHWDEVFVTRDSEALERIQTQHAEKLQQEKFYQWVFFEQWTGLRAYAAKKGIQFIGDIPIFVAMDSADTWANRDIFQLDEKGNPSHIAGVPPDYFSETGQRWGNPLFDWDTLAKTDYQWWIERVKSVLKTVDIVRIDHFRGFESYWSIPAEEPTAINGEWVEGPKDAFFEAIRAALGNVPFIAEDLGDITEEVLQLRDRQNLPGMRVLQFAFDGDPQNVMLPENFVENAVAYTGTHDNDTSQGWYDKLGEHERHRVRTYLRHGDARIVWAMIESLLASRADLVVTPVQDLLELGTDARMNVPGVSEGNWNWRLTKAQFDREDIWQEMRELTGKYGRQTVQ